MGWTGTAPNETYVRTDGTRTGSAVNVTADGAGVNNTAQLADNRENDFATTLNLVLKRDGGNQPVADLPMDTHKFTGLSQGTARTDSIRLDQVQDGDLLYAAVSGTANAIELALTPVSSGPVEGMMVLFIPASDNNDAVTVNLDEDDAVALEYNSAALVGGELQGGQPAIIIHDGTNWQLANPAVKRLLTRLASTANGQGASLIGIEDAAGNFDATNVEAALAEVYSDLASNSNGLGASLVGIEDTAGNFTATDVEGALSEIFSDFASTSNGLGASLIGIEDSGSRFTATTVEGALVETLFPSGTLMLFQQTAAPTGWTKQTTHNNKALRVVSGTASSGGTTVFSSVFDSRTPTGTVAGHALTISEMPAHTHNFAIINGSAGTRPRDGGNSGTTTTGTTASAGSGNSHNHGWTGNAMDFDVQYVDLIIASKD
jgi:hypothetical protein